MAIRNSITGVAKTVARAIGSLPAKFDRYALVLSFIALGLVTLIELFDSFGLDRAMDDTIAEVAANWAGPFYGREGGRVGQDEILVVLIDDDDLYEIGVDNFPIPYTAQARLIDALVEHQPRSIFLDFRYERPRAADREVYEFAMLTGGEVEVPQEVQELGAAIANAERRGIKIYTGPVSSHPMLGPLAQGHQVSDRLPVDGYYQPVYQYFGGIEAQEGAITLMPAAISMYSDQCAQLTSNPECADELGTLHDRIFYVQWGLGASGRQLARIPQEMQARCATSDSALVGLLGVLGRGATRGVQPEISDDNIAEQCTYHDTLKLRSILADNDAGNPIGPSVKGRSVFIGADTVASGDRWPAPFYKEVPGVAVHAMAFDNLVTYAGEVPLVPRKFYGIDGNDLLQLAFVTTLLIIFLAMSRNRKMALTRVGEGGKTELRRITVGIVFLAIVLATALFVYLSNVMRWPYQFFLLNLAAPAGLTAFFLLIIGRLSRNRIGEADD